MSEMGVHILETLIALYAEQEGVKITYELEKQHERRD